MKLKLVVMLVVVACILQACTSTYDMTTIPRESHPWMETQYRTYHDFLAEAKGKTVRIVLTDGRELLATMRWGVSSSLCWWCFSL